MTRSATDIVALTAVVDPVARGRSPRYLRPVPDDDRRSARSTRTSTNLKATVEPYKQEISQAGKRLADATSHLFDKGLQSGAPAGRVVPVLTPHPCINPIPDPGEAQKDSC